MLALALCIVYLVLIVIYYHRDPFRMASPTLSGPVLDLGLDLGPSSARYNGNVREFVWPKTTGPSGYDGQFSYFIARDPTNAAPLINAMGDVAAYRYQRILHPILARLLALGQDSLIPWVMVAINLVALAIGTAAMEQLLIAERASPWYALVYGLFGGVFFAIRVDTAEPLAYGLVLLAILAGQRNRLVWQAILLALAVLAKETTIFFVAGYLAYYALERRWRDLVRLALIGLVPFAAWELFLLRWLGQTGIGSGGALATPFEIIPFNGIWRLREFGTSVFVLFGLIPILTALLPTLWALWRGVRDVIRRRGHPYVFLMLANAAIIPFVPFSTYREPLGLARFLVGLVISVVLYAAMRRALRPLRYSTFWVLFGARLIG
jgi:hypothetical protein